MGVGELDLLTQMMRDLNAKVDKIASEQVTRYEFTELASRIDKFVLHSEFEQYKLYATSAASVFAHSINSKIDAMVPRSEHETRWAEEEKRFTSIEGKLPTGKLPQWATNLIIAVMAAVIGGVSSGVISHATQPQAPAPTVQPYNAKH